MKGIITNAEKSLGLILPGDKDEIVPLGRFSLELLYSQLKSGPGP
jgi:hypothetical protein